MSTLRKQIHERMNLKETDKLLEIWQSNDRAEWSDDAFEVVEEILKERGVDLPEQEEPVYEHKAEEEREEDDDFSDEELKIIEDENPPEFYDPFDVLLTTKRIAWIAKVMIAFTILYNVFNFPATMQMVQSYFIRNPDSILIYVITGLVLAVNAAIGSIVVYFPLKALAHILRILMEMEFRSRKGVPTNPLVE
jgi:hypothetical protein